MRDAFKPKTKTINVMLLDGGLGDHVAALVAVDYIAKTYPWINPLVWCPDYLVEFAKHLLPDRLEVRGFTEMKGQARSTHKSSPTWNFTPAIWTINKVWSLPKK